MRNSKSARAVFLSRLAGRTGGVRHVFPVMPRPPAAQASRPAAVLVPVMDRPGGLTVLLTRRSEALRDHAGQISFPGGRLDPQDSGPVDAALRESAEEIGLPRRHVRVLGWLDCCVTGTGFSIVPVVGLVTPLFRLRPDPAEVAEVFEVPLPYLANRANYRQRLRLPGAKMRHPHEIRYRHHHIWGATASILRALAEILEGT